MSNHEPAHQLGATGTYDQDPDTLPPLTKRIVESYGRAGTMSYGIRPADPQPNAQALRAMLDAIHGLELRIINLEQP